MPAAFATLSDIDFARALKTMNEGFRSDPSPRPLVVRFGALGDMILLTGLLDGLARRWGRPCDVVASRGQPRRVFAGLDSVGEVFTLGSRKSLIAFSPGQWRLVAWLRRRGPAPAYVIEDMAKVDRLLALGGLPRDHRLSMADLPRGDLEHVLDYYARVASACPPRFAGRPAGPLPEAVVPRLEVQPEERRDCRDWLAASGWSGEPLVLVQSESRRRKRGRWPRESWVAAVRGVLDTLPEARVLLTGSPAEASRLEELRRACGDARVRNVARELPLRRLFALAAHVHSAISLDTGPAHAVAVLGCPVVVLVGMADPRRNRPPGPPERVRTVTSVPEAEWPASRREWEAWHDVAQIRVAQVLDAWSLLGDGADAAKSPRTPPRGRTPPPRP